MIMNASNDRANAYIAQNESRIQMMIESRSMQKLIDAFDDSIFEFIANYFDDINQIKFDDDDDDESFNDRIFDEFKNRIIKSYFAID